MIFEESKVTQAYLKMGIMGFTGSGKTYTASKVAVGLHAYVKKELGDDLKVFFLDTETGSDFVLPMFHEVGIKVMQAKTRAFRSLRLAVKEAESENGILLIDSISHFWAELQDTYMNEKGRTRLLFQDWAWLKSQWRMFTDEFVNSQCHIIMCGRAGYEYDFFEDDAGKKELEKTGIRMKAETETGYEPSILVLMHREQELDRDGLPIVKRKGLVLKDRALGKYCLDGKTFVNPTFEDFKPHIEFLNIGGEHLGRTGDNSASIIPDDDPQWAIEKKQKEVRLDEIQCLLVKHYPSTKQVDKTAKADLLEKHFDTRSWERMKTYALIDLNAGYTTLLAELEPDKAPAAETKKQIPF